MRAVAKTMKIGLEWAESEDRWQRNKAAYAGFEMALKWNPQRI